MCEVEGPLAVAGVGVEVAGGGDAQQDGKAARPLHEAPAPRKMLGPDPNSKWLILIDK